MGILATGSGAAKAIGFITMPLITRIYTPEDFGVLAVFTSTLAVLVPIATLRYAVTIPLPKNDGLAFNIVVLGCFLISIFTIILGLVLFIFGDAVFGIFNMVEIATYWWLLVIGIIAVSVYELLAEWATRKRAFLPVAKTKVWQTTISGVVKIGMGLLGFKPFGLLLGNVLKQGGGLIMLGKGFYQDFKENFQHVKLSRVYFLWIYYRDLPIYRLPSQFLLVMVAKLPILFFAFQFGAESTGQLGLSFTVIAIPMSLLGKSTGKAYYAEIAKLGRDNKNKILELTKNVITRLSILGGIPCIGLIFTSQYIFNLVFGTQWDQAGVFTSVLAVFLFFQFISSPLVNVFNVLNKQSMFLQINVIRSLLMIIVFLCSYLLNLNEIETLISYSIILSIHYIYVFFQILYHLKDE